MAFFLIVLITTRHVIITTKLVIVTTKVDIKTTIFSIFCYKNGSYILKVGLLGRGDFFREFWREIGFELKKYVNLCFGKFSIECRE